jgi:hypothetical protein
MNQFCRQVLATRRGKKLPREKQDGKLDSSRKDAFIILLLEHGGIMKRLLSALLAASVAAAFGVAVAVADEQQPPAQPKSEAAPFTVKETSLGKLVNGMTRAVGRVSMDSRHFAYVALGDQKMFVVGDGVPRKQYDNIDEDSLVYSPDARHLAYAAQIGNKWTVVLDGKEGKQYSGKITSIIFSPDSTRMAYIARVGKQGFVVVVDGTEGKLYEGISDLAFSPDSKRLVYKASADAIANGTLNATWIVVLDGAEQSKWIASPGPVLFSPDSAHAAFLGRPASAGFGVCAILDDAAGKSYDIITDPVFSPDSQHLTYAAQLHQEPGQVAALWAMVRDGKEGQPMFSVFRAVFSPDSKHIAYAAGYATTLAIVLDEAGQGVYSNVARPSITFSPDSQRLAYVAGTVEGKTVVVTGRDKIGQYDDAQETLVYSPDSAHLAYAAKIGDKWTIVVDDAEQEKYDEVNAKLLAYSPDSAHLAFECASEGKHFTIVDGKKAIQHDGGVKGSRIVFDSPTKLHTLVQRDGEVFLVEIEINQ